mgnify:CR=1 FL=1
MLKKKIAILGSTGSIGKTLINIIKKDKKNFQIILLSSKKNYKELLKQARFLKVKNLIITDYESYLQIKKYRYSKNIKIYNNFSEFKKIFKKKVDYTMSSITGIEGLKPTLDIIKYSKKIAIANKESIICGWGLIDKELKKNKTKFIPVDSEHFSLWYGLINTEIDLIEKIYLTASGGPFYRTPLKKFKNVKIKQALKHPNWKMGNKISIDSATMINKIYEVIEAKNIFNIPYKKLSILIHPSSYIHAIIKYKNGLSKIILHDTDMKIPIFNSLNYPSIRKYKDKMINLRKLNELELSKVDLKRYPSVKILKYLPEKISLFETILVSANDALVNLFLKKQIKFTDISKRLLKLLRHRKYSKFKGLKPKKIDDIIKLNGYVRSVIRK